MLIVLKATRKLFLKDKVEEYNYKSLRLEVEQKLFPCRIIKTKTFHLTHTHTQVVSWMLI